MTKEIPFIYELELTCPHTDTLTDEQIENIFGFKKYNNKACIAKGDQREAIKTLKKFCANMLNALRSGPDTECFVSMNKVDYTMPAEDTMKTMYSGLSYAFMVAVKEHLVTNGFITWTNGVHDMFDASLSKRSSFKATQKGLESMQVLLGTSLMGQGNEELKIDLNKPEEYRWRILPQWLTDRRTGKSIIKQRKAEKGHKLDLDIGVELTDMNNKMLSSNDVFEVIAKEDNLYHQVQIDDNGGRVYSRAQGFPKEERANWRINGENLVEIDLVASHPSIFYSLKGMQAPSDCYKLKSFSDDENKMFRPMIKKIFNIAINVGQRRHAIDAMINTCAKDDELSKLLMIAKVNLDEENEKEVFGLILDAIEETHEVIKDEMYKDRGLFAQGIEGKLAIRVMQAAIDNQISCINIHDGFLCQESKAPALQNIIKAEIQKLNLNLVLSIKTFGNGLTKTSTVAKPAIVTKNSSEYSMTEANYNYRKVFAYFGKKVPDDYRTGCKNEGDKFKPDNYERISLEEYLSYGYDASGYKW